jgi:hypothetical protein
MHCALSSCDEIFVQAYLDENLTHKGKGLLTNIQRNSQSGFKGNANFVWFAIIVLAYTTNET